MQPAAPNYTGYAAYDYLEPGRDYEEFALAKQLGRVPAYRLELTAEEQERVTRIFADEVVFSLHEHAIVLPENGDEIRPYNRTGRQRTAYEGMARSGLTAFIDNFMAGASCVTSQNGWKWDDMIYALGYRLADLAKQDHIVLATSVADIHAARTRGQLALIAGFECATMIENELDRIDILYGFGLRQMGIAYSQTNMLGSGLSEEGDGGLTMFGKRAVHRMNQLGILIDISHSGDKTSLDTIAHSEVPVMITHAGARSVWPIARMKPDEVITACAERGGLIGLEAAPNTTISAAHPKHTLDSVMDHFSYCVDLVGIDHVAFGPDTMFGDHMAVHRAYANNYAKNQDHHPDHEPIEYVDGLENPGENFTNITGWLVKHGYSDEDIAKVLGGNIMRVLDQVW
ncbi:dipeptidase [Compostimonas suwonensis]|uniref:Membrane dipeptidase n=1 Tax=Compostimonas suwonensis TaxID=1048394 RepID=A0A2M9C0G2_9MICO|nr:membrane dipeptidase [Compostimonas suwonensis]PJJ63814.1 membrane dipeptidase [Compostimonas suwonensis]